MTRNHWFYGMTRKAQLAYIKSHPNSIYATRIKKAADPKKDALKIDHFKKIIKMSQEKIDDLEKKYSEVRERMRGLSQNSEAYAKLQQQGRDINTKQGKWLTVNERTKARVNNLQKDQDQMMEPRKIFNPLAHLAMQATAADADEPEQMKATASMHNTKVGVCPKCDEEMKRAVIANNDTVFYCEGCRVSTPLPDEQVIPVI